MGLCADAKHGRINVNKTATPPQAQLRPLRFIPNSLLRRHGLPTAGPPKVVNKPFSVYCQYNVDAPANEYWYSQEERSLSTPRGSRIVRGYLENPLPKAEVRTGTELWAGLH
jgi:hypothetical protein